MNDLFFGQDQIMHFLLQRLNTKVNPCGYVAKGYGAVNNRYINMEDFNIENTSIHSLTQAINWCTYV